jgi:hypothetical protein
VMFLLLPSCGHVRVIRFYQYMLSERIQITCSSVVGLRWPFVLLLSVALKLTEDYCSDVFNWRVIMVCG